MQWFFLVFVPVLPLGKIEPICFCIFSAPADRTHLCIFFFFFPFFSSLRNIFHAHTHIVTAIHFPFPPSCKPPHKPTILFSGSENSEKCKMFPALIISQIIDQLDQLSSVINCTKKRYIVTSNPAVYKIKLLLGKKFLRKQL